jgi:acyl-coenzyme A thioesterase PaaI-like protein
MTDLVQASAPIELLKIRFDEVSATRVSGSIAAGVVAVPVHQGRTKQLWQVEIRRPQDDALVARGQVRLANIDA